MKLSEIKGEKIFDVIGDIIPAITNIAVDPELADLFTKKPLPEGMLPWQFIAKRWGESVPRLIKYHKDDLVTILAILEDKTKEEYMKEMTITKMINDVLTILHDESFAQFFPSAQTKEAVTSSGSVPENTEGKA